MPSHSSRFPRNAVTISLAGLLALSCGTKDESGGGSGTRAAPAATAPADTAATISPPPAPPPAPPQATPPVTPPATPPAAAIPIPAAEAFVTRSEQLAEFTTVVPLAGGKAHLAAIATGKSDDVLRAVAGGARSDVLSYRTGDCVAGAIVELDARPDGTTLFRFGQQSYTDCDDENESNPKADIDSHVECVELRWDAAARAVVKGRQAKAQYTSDLPDWCRSE
jgi:hypothetical protein